MGIEILHLEMLISFIILLPEIIAILIVISSYPDRKRTLGIILVGISLGVIGLLAHAVYNLFELMKPPSYFADWRMMVLILVYIPSLVALFVGHSVFLLIGRKLIRKYGKKRAKIEK